jgi:hypothetical protein
MKTYFIHDARNGLVKIGRSADPWRRLKDLQVGSAARLILLAVAEGDHEHEWHTRFAGTRAHGEWFTVSADLATMLRDQFGVRMRPKRERPLVPPPVTVSDVRVDIEAWAQAALRSPDAGALYATIWELGIPGAMWVPGEDGEDDEDTAPRQTEEEWLAWNDQIAIDNLGPLQEFVEYHEAALLGWWHKDTPRDVLGVAFWLPRAPLTRERFLVEAFRAQWECDEVTEWVFVDPESGMIWEAPRGPGRPPTVPPHIVSSIAPHLAPTIAAYARGA